MGMKLDELKTLVADGKFHHATYRDHGTVWEGLWIYKHDESPTGFRGFSLAGCFSQGSPDLDEAYKIVRNSGVSVGSYGNG